MSRRSGRYERRKAKREANRLQRSLDVGGLSEVFTYHDLYSAGKQSAMLYAGRTVRNALSCTCSQALQDAGSLFWNTDGSLRHMFTS